MVGGAVRGRRPPEVAGFSLLEALVAVTLSTILITMIASVFVAQNRFYFDAVERSGAQERVRSLAEQIRSEFRAVSPARTTGPGAVDGIEVAEPDRLVFQAPLTIGVVCAPESGGKGKGKGGGTGQGKGKGKGPAPASVSAYIPRGDGGLAGGWITGYGVRGEDGTWRYFSGGWGSIVGQGGAPRDACVEMGDDGTADDEEYVVLQGGVPGNVEEGSLISLVSEIEFRFMSSELRPGTRALYRRVGEGPLVEFASGLSPDAGFQYRVGNGTQWLGSVDTPGERAGIRALRIVAEATAPGGAGEIRYGWVVDLPLRNAP